MDRRSFITYGTTTAVLVGSGAASLLAPGSARAATVGFNLTINDADVEMVDGSTVFMWAFAGGGDIPRVPGPVLQVAAGDTVTINVQNDSSTSHGFSIPGLPGTSISSISPGTNVSVTFTPNIPGSYMYIDPVNAPVNRVLGLHGAFVVTPANGQTSNNNPMPYDSAQATTQIDSLFSALGTGVFLGNTWVPSRDMIWMVNQVDPTYCRRAERGQSINAQDMIDNFLPRYFTLNGLSGFYASKDPNTAPHGHVGDPIILRTMNAGLATHSPHIHGNHIYELTGVDSSTGAVVVNDNLLQRDTWILGPMDRKDVLLPFRIPPDIPPAVWPPSEENFPLFYPMHCHMEMSQTAAGGMYPQGLVTDWVLEGP